MPAAPASVWFSEIRHLLTHEETRLHFALRFAAEAELPGPDRAKAWGRLDGFRLDMVEKYTRRWDPARVFPVAARATRDRMSFA